MNYIRCRQIALGLAIVPMFLGLRAETSAFTAALGVAVSNGTFHVDGHAVQQSSTIFDRSVIESGNLPTTLKLTQGTQLRLGPHSRIHIHGTRLILDQGVTQIINAQNYDILTMNLRVSPVDPNSVGRVEVPSDKSVTASAVTGSFRVFTIGGSLVAKIDAGTALNFAPQAQAAPAAQTATRVIGCVTRQGSRFILRDEITKSEFELLIAPGTQGVDLNREVGRRVELTGEAAAATGTPRTPRLLFTATALTRLGTCGNPLLLWFGAHAVPILAGVAVGSVVRGLFCEPVAPISP